MPTFNFTELNFESVLFDIVGIISFFIMATIMLWITISQYLWKFLEMLFQSGRKVQLIALVLFVVLCVSITLHAVKGSAHRNQQNMQSSSDRLQSPRHINNAGEQNPKCCHQKLCRHNKLSICGSKNLRKSKGNILSSTSNCNLPKKKNPSLCDLCEKKFKSDNTHSHAVASDDEIRQMYKKYKLYSIPSEMKTPPSIGNIIDFFTIFFNGS